jgi:hypothetical protein
LVSDALDREIVAIHVREMRSPFFFSPPCRGQPGLPECVPW